jgi:hypothetical protein
VFTQQRVQASSLVAVCFFLSPQDFATFSRPFRLLFGVFRTFRFRCMWSFFPPRDEKVGLNEIPMIEKGLNMNINTGDHTYTSSYSHTKTCNVKLENGHSTLDTRNMYVIVAINRWDPNVCNDHLDQRFSPADQFDCVLQCLHFTFERSHILRSYRLHNNRS